MIPKRAVRQFLERPRRNYARYKDLTDDEIEDKQARLPIHPPIWSRLLRVQKICFLLGAKLKRFAFHADTGTGKTFLSIALIRYFYKLGQVNHVLVLVPNLINKSEWAREIRKHSKRTSYVVLSGSSEQKWQQFEEAKALITIETYGGFMRMVSTLHQVKKRGRVLKKRKLKPDDKKIRRLLKLIDGLVLDESNIANNKHALPFRLCRRVAKKAEIVFELSGTPFGQDPMPLWGQSFLLDNGYTLGETMGLFRAAFYNESQDYWGRTNYTFRKNEQERLNRFLANISISYEANEADLPELVHIVKEVKLPKEATAYYDAAREMVVKAHGNYREMKNGFLRMRQISSGFLGYHDDETGTRAQIEFRKDNRKLQMLLSLIDEIGPGKKILVFHDFVFSGSIICRELEKAKIGHLRLHKVKDEADAQALLDRFDNDPSIRVFVMNTAGAYGLNFQVAQYGIFYESPVSVILRKQMRRRFERQHSQHGTVFMYDLIVRGTVDRQILDAHKRGEDLFDAIIRGNVKPMLRRKATKRGTRPTRRRTRRAV